MRTVNESKDDLSVKGYIYIAYLYCHGVQAGFYSDAVECMLRMLEDPGSIPGREESLFACYIRRQR